MKIYLAARYSRQSELRVYTEQLRAAGHTITSRWLGQHDELPYEELTAAGCRRCAEHDIEDVCAADCVISFTEPVGEPTTSRGGRHVETGVAIGMNRAIYGVGPRENVFHWLPYIEFFETFDLLLEHLNGK